jgi:hypothetical protein
MKTQHSTISRLAFVLLAGLVAACDQMPSPSDIKPQLAPGGNTVNVQFQVTRADDATPVANATVSVYLTDESAPVFCPDGATVPNQNCWLTTDANGVASINVPNNSNLGYLVRSVSPEWTSLATQVIPPLVTPTLTGVDNDLGAITCGNSGPVQVTPGSLKNCVDNLYVDLTGSDEVIPIALPVLPSRSVQIKNLNGTVVGGTAYLIEELPTQLPWQDLLPGQKAGFLRYVGDGSALPGANGYVEVYAATPEGFEIAGTSITDGTSNTVVETNPVICANPTGQPNVQYTANATLTNPAFSFIKTSWAYAAKRGNDLLNEPALIKDLTTTAVVVEFTQPGGGSVSVEFSQRVRKGGTTQTASGTVTCVGGVCTGPVYATPGSNNPLTPLIFQPKPGKLFFVVKNVDPNASSELSVKASGQGVQMQLPESSKNNATSAFFLFSKGFTFCDPDFSFDGVWGCEV